MSVTKGQWRYTPGTPAPIQRNDRAFTGSEWQIQGQGGNTARKREYADLFVQQKRRNVLITPFSR